MSKFSSKSFQIGRCQTRDTPSSPCHSSLFTNSVHIPYRTVQKNLNVFLFRPRSTMFLKPAAILKLIFCKDSLVSSNQKENTKHFSQFHQIAVRHKTLGKNKDVWISRVELLPAMFSGETGGALERITCSGNSGLSIKLCGVKYSCSKSSGPKWRLHFGSKEENGLSFLVWRSAYAITYGHFCRKLWSIAHKNVLIAT